MPEPTIDEMLASLDGAARRVPIEHHKAIRAILEQLRDVDEAVRTRAVRLNKQVEIEAIRAFVERVEKKWGTSRYTGMLVELQEMEKESNEHH